MSDLPPPSQPHLGDEPSKLITYIKSRRKVKDADGTDKPHYNFTDFVSDMQTTNFEDDYQMRAMLESQAHLLSSAFQFLMMEGDFKNLTSILRTQRNMRDTMELMNKFPLMSWHHAQQAKLQKDTQEDAPPLD